MKIPASTKPALLGALGGAIVLALVGFTWGGWTTEGSARTAAKKDADQAVVATLTPICVAQFQKQPDAAAKLVELKAVESWNRDSFVEKGGWATMPGAEKAVSGVAEECADALIAKAS